VTVNSVDRGEDRALATRVAPVPPRVGVNVSVGGSDRGSGEASEEHASRPRTGTAVNREGATVPARRATRPPTTEHLAFRSLATALGPSAGRSASRRPSRRVAGRHMSRASLVALPSPVQSRGSGIGQEQDDDRR